MTACQRVLVCLCVPMLLLPAAGRAQNVDGRAIYLKNCRSCHGNTGTPSKQALRETPKIAKLDQAFLAARSDDSLRVVIANGAGKDMKAFKEKLSPQEIEAVVKYLRTLGEPPKS